MKLWTLISDKFVVSTIYRQSSVQDYPEMWYYETMTFAWDKETRKMGEIIDQIDSGSDKQTAAESHFNICDILISIL